VTTGYQKVERGCGSKWIVVANKWDQPLRPAGPPSAPYPFFFFLKGTEGKGERERENGCGRARAGKTRDRWIGAESKINIKL
jgi:hypothetical protein